MFTTLATPALVSYLCSRRLGSTLREEFYGTVANNPAQSRTSDTFYFSPQHSVRVDLFFFLFLQPVHNFCHHYVDWETFYLFIAMARRRLVGSAMSQLDTTASLADRILFDTIMRYWCLPTCLICPLATALLTTGPLAGVVQLYLHR